jgi:hypothetical protein
MILAAVPYILQLFCIIDIFRKGASTYWIYLILFVPYVGGAAYLIVEILPRMRVKNISSIPDLLIRKVSPSARLRALKNEYDYLKSSQNKYNLMNEYLVCGYPSEALVLVEELFTDPIADKREVLLAKAECLHALGRDKEAETVLADFEKKYAYKKEREHLLRLTVFEKTRPQEETEALFAEMKTKLNTFEAKCYYIEYLIRCKKYQEAAAEIEEIKKTKKDLLSRGYRFERKWADKATSLKNLIPG